MKVVQTNYGTSIDILFNLDPYTARPIMVESTGVEAGSDGRKIVKAGTPLDKDGVLANDATARYILLKDVDVTYGDAAGAGVYRGTLDLAKIEKNLTVDEESPFVLSEAAQAALKGIIFMSDDDLDYVVGDSAAIEEIDGRVEELEEVVLTATTGLKDVVTAPSTGLVDRVTALEG